MKTTLATALTIALCLSGCDFDLAGANTPEIPQAAQKVIPLAGPENTQSIRLEGLLNEPGRFNEFSVIEGSLDYIFEYSEPQQMVYLKIRVDAELRPWEGPPDEWIAGGVSWEEVDMQNNATFTKGYILQRREQRTVLNIELTAGEELLTLERMWLTRQEPAPAVQ